MRSSTSRPSHNRSDPRPARRARDPDVPARRKPPELAVAREYAEVVLADVAIDVLLGVLRFEHPRLDDDYEPDDDVILVRARHLASRAFELRREIDRFRAAVRHLQQALADDDD